MTSRRSQPYRKGARDPGQTLMAMLRGRALNKPHPMDPMREAQRLRRKRQRTATADTRGIFR